MGHYLAGGELVVIETDEDHYLGTAEIHDEVLIVRSGFVGRPVLLELEDIQSVTAAFEHPLVERADEETPDLSELG